MRRRSVALAFVFFTIMPQFAQEVAAQKKLPSQPAGNPPAAPSIEFLRPLPNEQFFNYPIYVQLKVSNFRLVPPGPQAGVLRRGDCGHVNISLDDFPVLEVDDTQVMLGKNLGRGYIPVGNHVLKAQLVNESGDKVGSPCMTYVTSGHPASSENMLDERGVWSDRARAQELQLIKMRLDEIEKGLTRIKNGSAGYQPDPTLKNNGRTGE